MPTTHKNSMPVGVSSPKYGVTHKRVGVFQNNPLTDVSSAIKSNDQCYQNKWSVLLVRELFWKWNHEKVDMGIIFFWETLLRMSSYLDNCYKTSCSSAPSTLCFWYTLLMTPTMDKQHFYLCMMKLIKQDNKFNEKIKNCCHIVATMITTTFLGLQHEEFNL